MSHLLLLRGYELSGLAPITTGRVATTLLRRHAWWKKRMFRLQRFGLALTTLNALAQRIGPNALHRWTTLRMQQITTRYLK